MSWPGSAEPVVEMRGGGARPGQVVFFDPVHDLAVIQCPGSSHAGAGTGRDLSSGDNCGVRRLPARRAVPLESCDGAGRRHRQRARHLRAESLAARVVLAGRERAGGQLGRAAAGRRTAASPESCSPRPANGSGKGSRSRATNSRRWCRRRPASRSRSRRATARESRTHRSSRPQVTFAPGRPGAGDKRAHRPALLANVLTSACASLSRLPHSVAS